MIKKVNIDGVNCSCIAADQCGSRVVYMIYPDAACFSDQWLQAQSRENECSIVMVYVGIDKWNNWLTPWPEPGETKKAQPFGGEAKGFLDRLQTKIIPECERILGMAAVVERDLIGVSLGGLFALWQWTVCDTFHSIACLSGSFWYDGFVDWLASRNLSAKHGKAFLLLGKDEPKSWIKTFRSVGVNTETIVDMMKKAGIDVEFEWVSGDHFANPEDRARKALEALRMQG